MSNPSHIEIIVTEGEEVVAKAADESTVTRLNTRQKARANRQKLLTAA